MKNKPKGKGLDYIPKGMRKPGKTVGAVTKNPVKKPAVPKNKANKRRMLEKVSKQAGY